MPVAARNVGPALALHRNDDRRQSVLEWHVDRAQRLLAHGPVDRKTMRLLEPFDRRPHRIVVVPCHRPPHESHRYQPVAQRDDPIAALAGPQDTTRHRRGPAALGQPLLEGEFLTHQTCVFRARRWQAPQKALWRCSAREGGQGLLPVAQGHLSHDMTVHGLRRQDAGLDVGRVVEQQAAQFNLHRSGLRRRPGRRKTRHQRGRIVEARRQTVILGAVERGKERVAPRLRLGAVAGPDALEPARPVEGRKIGVPRCGLRDGLPERRDLRRGGPCPGSHHRPQHQRAEPPGHPPSSEPNRLNHVNIPNTEGGRTPAATTTISCAGRAVHSQKPYPAGPGSLPVAGHAKMSRPAA